MKIRVLKIVALVVMLLLGIIGIVFFKSTKNYLLRDGSMKAGKPLSAKEYNILHQKAKGLLRYAKKNGFDTTVCFLINMKIPSGRKRFFVYDFAKQKITQQGLVTHGGCYSNTFINGQYSNVVGSGCTSLGKYKIANAYQGKFGLAYKLHGLDSSNSNAFERFVVMHSHSCVPNNEVAPYPICQSEGCPTVSPDFLKILANIIDGKKKSILLEIFAQ